MIKQHYRAPCLWFRMHLKNWPSVLAEQQTSAGTDHRSGVHLLQPIINKINGTCEIGDTQAAAVCLGLPCNENPAMQRMFSFMR